jgi:hypothetical protein
LRLVLVATAVVLLGAAGPGSVSKAAEYKPEMSVPSVDMGSAGIVQIAAASAASADDVAYVQELLNELGFDAGVVDGVMGSRTRNAIRQFERAQNMPVTGQVSEELITRLEQTGAGSAAEEGALLTTVELDALVGPIALYPDELLGILLPASTFPLQIVQAARFLEKKKTDPDLKPDEDWDTSVVSLLNYPEVIEMMNEDLDWTWALGEAVLNQQADVMDSIQQFRAQADTAGNLESNEQQVVVKEKEVIYIKPADPEVIYVPQYQPSTVIVYNPAPVTPVVTYYAPYPAYYAPAATFWSGMFVGAAVGYGLSWAHHEIWDHHHYDYRRHGDIDIDIDRDIDIDIDRDIDIDIDRERRRESASERRRDRQSWRSGREDLRTGARPKTERRRQGDQVGKQRAGNGGVKPASRDRRSREVSRAPRRQDATSGTRKKRTERTKKRKRKTSADVSKRQSPLGGYKRGQDTRKISKKGKRSRSATTKERTSKRRSQQSAFGGYSGGGKKARSVSERGRSSVGDRKFSKNRSGSKRAQSGGRRRR